MDKIGTIGNRNTVHVALAAHLAMSATNGESRKEQPPVEAVLEMQIPNWQTADIQPPPPKRTSPREYGERRKKRRKRNNK